MKRQCVFSGYDKFGSRQLHSFNYDINKVKHQPHLNSLKILLCGNKK